VLPELSAKFFVSLGGIIVADLVLAGDNAVVIALAARNLPKALRRRAVFYGASAAIVLRTLLTVAAVFLLKAQLPFLMLVGGAALLYIAWQLAVEEEHDHEGIDSATTMRGAIRTILVADVVMSIDNVLAVAAIGKQNIWLVVLGLLVSVPIIMGGASILLKVIDRFPVIVWLGAALIAYVGMELILVDPVVHHRLPSLLESTWHERVLSIVVAIVLTSLAWYRRATDDDSPPDDPRTGAGPTRPEEDRSESRLMVEGPTSDA
jgi:YjbE family integral membrane protein